MMKKFISIALLVTVCATLFLGYSVHAMTAQEGANWALAQVGKRIDTDGRWGAQCVDLIVQYCKTNFGWNPQGSGNAEAYRTVKLPNASWKRIQNTPDFLPQPGDIAIWNPTSGNGYCGHVAIIVSANLQTFVSVDQNWVNANAATGSPAAKVTHNYNGFWGVIRPPFSAAASSTTQNTAPPAGNGEQTVKDGLYTLKNVSSGYMLNVYAGKDANGTQVTTWAYDGTTDQRIYIQHAGNGRYLLKFNASASGRVVDVNRGESLTASIDDGDKIDIWTANDPNAQYFYINACGDGAYTFELVTKADHVIAATGSAAAASNGTQLQLKKYTGAAYQKWYICDTSGNKVDVCIHKNISERTTKTTYASVNDMQHTAVTYYDRICGACGVAVERNKASERQENHAINGTACSKCDYTVPTEEECEHTNLNNSEVKSSTVSVKDENYHVVTDVFDVYCDDCSAIIKSSTENTYDKPHEMENGKCTLCSYTENNAACLHENAVKQSADRASVYAKNDESTHIVTRYYNLWCGVCTSYANMDLEEKETAAHTFIDNTCQDCGYTKAVETTAYVYNTDTDNLNMRAQASVESPIIAKIPAGAAITVTGDAVNGFYPVKYNGNTGYASAAYITFTKPTPENQETIEKTGYVYNTGGLNLNLRAKATTQSAVLAKMPEGSTVTVIGDTENGFYPVKYNGKTGYAFAAYLTFDKPSGSTVHFMYPVSGTISCRFNGYPGHKGVDFAVTKGTSVKASKSGTVSIATAPCTHNYGKKDRNGNPYSCGCGGGYGNYVKINHGDGTETLYAHLTSLSVQKGQYVAQGQEIGKSGSTGYSSGFHLHFEIRFNGEKRDPLNYLQ